MSLNAMPGPSDVSSIPVLTEVLAPGTATEVNEPDLHQAVDSEMDLLGAPALDMAALERCLVDAITQRLQGALEQRVHASVAPAVSLLADRIAYKAAQEVAADLAERMAEDLKEAVRLALDDAVRTQRFPSA
jgi:uncharacterized protein (DUF4415 family)